MAQIRRSPWCRPLRCAQYLLGLLSVLGAASWIAFVATRTASGAAEDNGQQFANPPTFEETAPTPQEAAVGRRRRPVQADRTTSTVAKGPDRARGDSSSVGASNGGVAASGAGKLTVVVAAGPDQVLGAAVVFHSALRHAARPEALRLRVVTFAADEAAVLKSLRARIQPSADLAVVAFDAWVPRVRRLLGGNSSLRAELFGALNFAAFYLHELFPGGRVLYLDTDVVVVADIVTELLALDLKGKPLAVVRDCSQKVNKYLRFDRLKKKDIVTKLPQGLKKEWKDWKACVVNRGVVLVDSQSWASANITGTIEALLHVHISDGPLWRSGVSQPPFLLAVSGYYHDLGNEYNVRGLGRGDISPLELEHYRGRKIWKPYFDSFISKCKFNCCEGCKGYSYSPYLSPTAHHAKILHFNGRLKPAAAGFRSAAALEVPPKQLPDKAQSERELRPLCSCGDRCVRECAGIWWDNLPPDGNKAVGSVPNGAQ